MIPDARFLRQPKQFWAHVRSISEEVGYTVRGKGAIKVPDMTQIVAALESLGLRADHIASKHDDTTATAFGKLLHSYFDYRARILNEFVEPRLMDVVRAKRLFKELCDQYRPERCDIPWNKQKGKKKTPAYLTAIVGMLIKAHAPGITFDLDPRSLTTITRNGRPLRTLARRVDGAFPKVVNPIALWEIKEYYHTTTFGSRVADGVYESLLDGMELEELREHEGIDVKHYLIVDAHYTWWDCGRSYLCRIIDMLHMGYVDEVLFGYEVVERLPSLVKEWVTILHQREMETARRHGGKPAGFGMEPK
jgi:hypothetical protein